MNQLTPDTALRPLSTVHKSVRTVLRRFRDNRDKSHGTIQVRGWSFQITRFFGSRRLTVKAGRRLVKDSKGKRRWEHFPSKAVLREAGFTTTFVFNQIHVNFDDHDHDKAVDRIFKLIEAVTHRSYEGEAEKLLDA